MNEHFFELIEKSGTLLGVIVTAFATIALWRATSALTRETKRLAEATVQPHVVVTFTRNIWSYSHFMIEVSNTGNATAYDIEIVTTPPLSKLDGRGFNPPLPSPFSNLAVLRPGEKAVSELGDYAGLKDVSLVVAVTWARVAGSQKRETNTHRVDMNDFAGQSQLGEANPILSLAVEFKRFSEKFTSVLGSHRPLEVNIHTEEERAHQRAERSAEMERRRSTQASPQPRNE